MSIAETATAPDTTTAKRLQGPFVAIPVAACEDSRLSHVDLLTLGIIVHYERPGIPSRIGQAHIAALIHVSPRTILRSIKRLVDTGWLSVTTPGRHRVNRYSVNWGGGTEKDLCDTHVIQVNKAETDPAVTLDLCDTHVTSPCVTPMSYKQSLTEIMIKTKGSINHIGEKAKPSTATHIDKEPTAPQSIQDIIGGAVMALQTTGSRNAGRIPVLTHEVQPSTHVKECAV